MSRRLPEPPPVLAGYTAIRPLGSGGFADVFLYEQSMPRRTVAVKVLLSSVSSGDVREMFLSETTLMAQLASHPSVLTVYEASISPDGRPYLVMEHCPSSYGQRFRSESIPVSEVLQVAIGIGSVLETAHRDGVLHRDIKPANILVTQYGKPVLGDFGIASTLARSERQEATGMSIPWSAPEVVSGATKGNVRTEVWGFAATLYSLLAGRSPFEVPGKSNTRDDVQRRILGRQPVGPIGREDVPRALERALLAALAKNPDDRPSSMLELLREIQLVESELGLRPSVLDIATERVIDASAIAPAPRASAGESSGGTGSTNRRRRIRTSGGDTTGSSASASSSSGAAQTVLRAWSVDRSGASPRRGGRIALIASAAAVVVIGAVVGGIALFSGGANQIPQVGDIQATASGSSITFEWGDPGIAPDDSYLVRVDGSSDGTQTSRSLTVDRAAAGERVCVTVTVVRDGRNGTPSDSTCWSE